jgi:hypothetical protein
MKHSAAHLMMVIANKKNAACFFQPETLNLEPFNLQLWTSGDKLYSWP